MLYYNQIWLKFREAEKAAVEQRMGNIFQIIKKLCGKKTNTNIPVRDKQGTLITSDREQEDRWKDNFKENLNKPDPTITAEMKEAEVDHEIDTELPSKTEIRIAIKSLKNNKAPG